MGLRAWKKKYATSDLLKLDVSIAFVEKKIIYKRVFPLARMCGIWLSIIGSTRCLVKVETKMPNHFPANKKREKNKNELISI